MLQVVICRTYQKIEKQISPAARKLANETKIDINNVEGSGKNGVILKEDIMSLMGSKPAPSERKIKHGPEERVKMTRLRLTIAKRLKEAQENAAGTCRSKLHSEAEVGVAVSAEVEGEEEHEEIGAPVVHAHRLTRNRMSLRFQIQCPPEFPLDRLRRLRFPLF